MAASRNAGRGERAILGRWGRRRSLASTRGFALLTALAVCGGLACAHQPTVAYAPDELRSVVTHRWSAVSKRVTLPEVEVPYALDAEWAERARRLAGNGTPRDRAQRLAHALTDPRVLGLRYDSAVTAAALPTLEAGVGNCLALTSVFVGLARAAGLRAYYLKASERQREASQEAGFIVSTDHIAAVVETGTGVAAFDFAGEITRYRRFGILSDIQALAHHYNNLGFQEIREAEEAGEPTPWDRVEGHFVAATWLDPQFALAWNNLGIVHARLGDQERAIRYYREALERDDRLGAPYHNLGLQYQARGELRAAVRAFREAVRREPDNPFLHLRRGMALYEAGRLEEAATVFERAIVLGAPDARSWLDRTRRALREERRAALLGEPTPAL
ncbi:MAG: tetratricopeptide repeat protein [Proteobacteria bacterium]|nr:tetratricopeptide repeat protein [Pseudomonadota bacterium]